MEAGKTEEMQPPRDLRPPPSPLASVLLASILHFHLSPSLYIFPPHRRLSSALPVITADREQADLSAAHQEILARGLQMSCQVQGPDHKGNKRSPPHRQRKKKKNAS